MVEDVEDGGFTPEDTDMVLDTPSPRGMYLVDHLFYYQIFL